MKIEIKVSGMKCKHCAKNLEDDLADLQGVSNVVVNFKNQMLCLEYDEEIITFDDINEVIANNGFKINLN